MTNVIDVGVPTPEYLNNGRFNFVYHRFMSITANKNECVPSTRFQCFGHEWTVELFPFGSEGAEDGNISVFLHHCSDGKIMVDLDFFLQTKKNQKKTSESVFSEFTEEHGKWGFVNFSSRNNIISVLDNGALTIFLEMKVQDSHNKSLKHFIPKNPSATSMAKLFLDEESSDVTFELNNGVKVCADRCILKIGAPDLFNICKDYDASTPVALGNIDEHIFYHVLGYIYGIDIPIDAMKNTQVSKALLDASHEYDIIGLKVESEAWYTMSFGSHRLAECHKMSIIL